MGCKITRSSGRGVSRRNFLKSTVAVSTLIGAPSLGWGAAGDVSLAPAAAGTGPFLHGVASGDPLPDRVILWTRVTLPQPPIEIRVDYTVATDTALRNVVVDGRTVATRGNDYTVKVDVTGLSPDTTYYYRFRIRGAKSPIGRTKTLPVGGVDRLRVGVVSCASLAHGYFNAYRLLAQRADVDVVVHLGDYIYEFGDGEYGDLRSYEPPHEIRTLVDYRTRHNQYKTDADLRELHRQHPMIAMWDDHEFADDAWTGGAANHDPATEGNWNSRVAGALRAYYEWMPIRQMSADRRHAYRSFRIGDLVELFMVEERLLGRSEQVEPNIIADTPLFTQEANSSIRRARSCPRWCRAGS
jgi:alkaline phosphatase D